MEKCNKIKMTCGTKVNSVCVDYTLDLPEYSELYEMCDVSIQDTTEDTYNLITELREDIDLSTLTGSDCITYPTEKTLLNVIQALTNFVCGLQTTIEGMQEQLDTQQAEIEALQNQQCP